MMSLPCPLSILSILVINVSHHHRPPSLYLFFFANLLSWEKGQGLTPGVQVGFFVSPSKWFHVDVGFSFCLVLFLMGITFSWMEHIVSCCHVQSTRRSEKGRNKNYTQDIITHSLFFLLSFYWFCLVLWCHIICNGLQFLFKENLYKQEEQEEREKQQEAKGVWREIISNWEVDDEHPTNVHVDHH